MGFRTVHASSDASGYDRGYLYDSALLDHLRAARKEDVGTWVELSCVDPSAYSDLAVLPDGTICCLLRGREEKPVRDDHARPVSAGMVGRRSPKTGK